MYAGTGGSLDRIKADRVQEFLEFAVARFHAEQAELMQEVDAGEWGDEIEDSPEEDARRGDRRLRSGLRRRGSRA